MSDAPDLQHIHPDLRALARPIGELNEDPANANLHNENSLDGIAASFLKFGQRKPLVVRREGMIVEAGSGALASLRRAGWTHLACVVCDDDEQTATAYALADNQTARLSDWNFEQLRTNTESLLAENYDMTELGFAADDLANILAGKSQELAEGLGSNSTATGSPLPSSDVEELGSSGSDNAGGNTLITALRWGKTKCPMTDEDLAALELAFKEHMDTFGSPFGFVSRLLET